VIPGALTRTLLSHVAQESVRPRVSGVADAVRLTSREREIMRLIASGLSNKAIAWRFGIATYTVKNHVHHILGKLTLHSRLEIALYTRKGRGAAPRTVSG
jgi:two-component system, NarL family, nitrate/nitrite response regulator NarL